AGNATFNRAKLLNIGVREALRLNDWDCVILHDVDLVPENDFNLYICDEDSPKHLASAMDKFMYSLPYWTYFGGVSAVTPEQYMKMNGFPNTYWGWGGEDDDIALRIRLSGMSITRTLPSIGRYKMVQHERDVGNEENGKRHDLLRTTRKTWREDGMNSLVFKLLSRKETPLYTNITVDLGIPPAQPTKSDSWRLF
ncbi:beta-1,4-galactosyltransferase 3-like, partial [Discoglossus pictus]